jgi:UDP-2-acetamido-2,6-beta-L-arabino-hexul-4-ose reductase
MTGANGFLGKNMQIHLSGLNNVRLITIAYQDSFESLPTQLEFDFILHFAGVNRSDNSEDFETGNVGFTKTLIKYAESKIIKPNFIFASSIHSQSDNFYGKSKLTCENLISDYSKRNNKNATILRLPNIYGKWAKPNYNSVVATFATKVINNQEIEIFDQDALIPFVYIDDLCVKLLKILGGSHEAESLDDVTHKLTPKQVLEKFNYFKDCNDVGLIPGIRTKSDSNLLSTFLSYLPNSDLKSATIQNSDTRGAFTEIFKIDQGSQTSLIRMLPNSVRGNHLHNSKIEKFFVITGTVRFTFRNPFNSDEHHMTSDGNLGMVILAIPGWWHSIQNIGDSEALVLVWANELFDLIKPDTYNWEW